MPIHAVVTISETSAVASSRFSTMVPANLYNEPFDLSFGLAFATAFGSGRSISVQHTLDKLDGATNTVGAGLTWYDHSAVSAASSNVEGSYTEPVAAVRIRTKGSAAIVSGNHVIKFSVLQTGY